MTGRTDFTFSRGPRISRRGLILSAGAAGLTLASGAHRASAASGKVLKVGFISPRTGALGGFGETDGYVLEVARKALASGLKIGDTTYEVKILDQDTQSDPSRAGSWGMRPPLKISLPNSKSRMCRGTCCNSNSSCRLPRQGQSCSVDWKLK